jgi:hypothetical protein
MTTLHIGHGHGIWYCDMLSDTYNSRALGLILQCCDSNDFKSSANLPCHEPEYSPPTPFARLGWQLVLQRAGTHARQIMWC